jgi:predicted ABC-type ATPase
MEPSEPSLYVIAGPNGAGKTTFARTFLPKYADCLPFVNADLIALGLSPFAPEAAALRAGRLVLDQIKDLSRQRVDFGLETTLSGKSYALLFRRLRQEGYRVNLFFLWIPDANMAVARVASRVRRGGHHIPEDDIRRRHARGMRNFVEVYRPLLDSWILFENSGETPIIIALEAGGGPEVRAAVRYARFLEGSKADE